MTLQTRLIILICTLAVTFGLGFGSSWYISSKVRTAEKVAQQTQQIKATTQEVKISNDMNSHVMSQVSSNDSQIANDRELLAKHFHHHRKATNHETVSCTAPWTLDNYTFGLLNAARTSTAYRPTFGSDAESSASSGVTEAQFIDNDTQIVGMYNNLAARHNTLVDYVNSLEKRINGRASNAGK